MTSSIQVTQESDRPDRRPEMQRVDTSTSARLPILMEMVGALSRASDPQEVLRSFSAGFEKLEGPRGYVSLSTRNLGAGEYRITRILVGDTAGTLGTSNPWGQADALPVYRGGFLGELIREAYPQVMHDLTLKDDAVVGDELAEYGSAMAIPLFERGEPLNWAILFRHDPQGYSITELEDTVLRANLVGATVRNVLDAQKLREANARVQREVDEIAKIQRSLLPAKMPEIRGVQLGASFETFDKAGGDIYDLSPLRTSGSCGCPDPEGPWLLHIADASGHGPAAATYVAMLNAVLRATHDETQGPAEMLTFANRLLYNKRLEGTFVTAVLARYDPISLRLTYARAGHNPPLLMTRANDRAIISRLDQVGGVPLGVLPDVAYEDHSIQLRPGQTLVLFTDGITEARSPTGEMFEVGGIERSLNACSGDPDCVISHVTGALLAHEAGERPGDDQTLLVMQLDR